MREPDRAQGSIRRYGDADLARVRFIKSAQRLGFSLHEVAELLKLEDGSHCKEAREQAERKLAEVRTRLDGLRRIEATLTRLAARCRNTSGKVSCPLIASLQQS